jgi:peptide/nickel transport system ATP-binding protein
MTQPIPLALQIDRLHIDIATPAGNLPVVRNVRFDLRAGETLALVGESGSGKSMTAMAIMGLLPRVATRRAGRLEIAGRDITALSDRQMEDVRGRQVGMIFQDPMTSLNPAYTIGDQLAEMRVRHFGAGRAAAWRHAEALLAQTGVTAPADRMRQYPHQLSGGLRQRVVIAMAMMCAPPLLLADEPTTALDATTRVQVLRLLRRHQRETGAALLIITHDLGVVAAIADRVAVMYAGEIIEQGDRAQIFSAPRHSYTRALLDAVPDPMRGKPGMAPPFVTQTPYGAAHA